MDKTTTWLVRSASLIVILFGIGYVSKPLGNKINSFIAPDIVGIACHPDPEILNNTDRELFYSGYTSHIDRKNGDLYIFDHSRKGFFNYLDNELIKSKRDFHREIAANEGYIKDGFLFKDVLTLSGGEIISRREPKTKLNLITLEQTAHNFEGEYLKLNCRYIEIPVEITIIEPDGIWPGF